MAERSSAEDALGALFGKTPVSQPPTATRASKAAAKTAAGKRAPKATPKPARKPLAAAVRAEVYLPEDVLDRAKSLVRPERTGAQRTLSAALILEAYIRVLDERGLIIDTLGLERDSREQAVDRVRAALTELIDAEVERRGASQARRPS